MDYFHGIEEQLPKNDGIKQSIKNKLDELKRIDEELKVLEKKRKKLNAMLQGYSKGQVEQVQEEVKD